MILTVRTNTKREIIDTTQEVQAFITQQGTREGVCHIFAQHTTAAVSTVDLDPGTDLDYLDALDKLVPHLNFRHPHNPSHFPDHLLATLIGPSLSVPIARGELQLGVWQRVALFEFDGPRSRNIHVTILAKL